MTVHAIIATDGDLMAGRTIKRNIYKLARPHLTKGARDNGEIVVNTD